MSNVYSPESIGIKAPAGGFQQGAWYSGRQYWGGTLSDPGTIHPSSNQPGAGQAVSQDVVQQTNPANVQYIQQQQQQQQNIQPIQNINPMATPTGMPSQTGAGATTGGIGAGFNQPTIDLPSIYKNLYESSGISGLEKELSDKTTAYNEAISKINDNPFLSEANRVGRIQKLSTDFNNSIANLKNDVATKKADIETQLNIQTKQFDINSEQAQLALQQFNSLLESGAFSNASGEDIANITRATGLSSTMIQSAINATNQKNIKTDVINYDDGTNQGFAVINTQTGEIISKNVIAGSKPKSTGTGGLSASQDRVVTGKARTILQNIDTNYRTINGKLTKAKTTNDNENSLDYGKKIALSGDKLISAQEYMKAVEDVMSATGIDQESAGQYVTSAMTELGYSNWTPKK